jgi:hypothetical protein
MLEDAEFRGCGTDKLENDAIMTGVVGASCDADSG